MTVLEKYSNVESAESLVIITFVLTFILSKKTEVNYHVSALIYHSS